MWKITTRGFTLQEVLILVAMNLEPTLTAVKPEQRSSAIKTRLCIELRRLC
jgi:hypothetical protein